MLCSFVDRDIFMRHLGGGVGHVASPHEAPTDFPLAEVEEEADEQDCEDSVIALPTTSPAAVSEMDHAKRLGDGENDVGGISESDEDLEEDSDVDNAEDEDDYEL